MVDINKCKYFNFPCFHLFLIMNKICIKILNITLQSNWNYTMSQIIIIIHIYNLLDDNYEI